jgi:hypothetical protein
MRSSEIPEAPHARSRLYREAAVSRDATRLAKRNALLSLLFDSCEPLLALASQLTEFSPLLLSLTLIRIGFGLQAAEALNPAIASGKDSVSISRVLMCRRVRIEQVFEAVKPRIAPGASPHSAALDTEVERVGRGIFAP